MKKLTTFRLDSLTMTHMDEIAAATGRATSREVEDALELAFEFYCAIRDQDDLKIKYSLERYTDAMKARIQQNKEAAPE